MCHLILLLPFLALPIFWAFDLSVALPLYLSVLGISSILYLKIFQAMRQKMRTGREAMIGKAGRVIQDIEPEGKIEFASEIWDAVTKKQKFSEGEYVCIFGFQGLKLVVGKSEKE